MMSYQNAQIILSVTVAMKTPVPSVSNDWNKDMLYVYVCDVYISGFADPYRSFVVKQVAIERCGHGSELASIASGRFRASIN